MASHKIEVKRKQVRGEDSKLNVSSLHANVSFHFPNHLGIICKLLNTQITLQKVIIVGAGLGGLGAAISILLAGHIVTVLESASEIAEVGAGIQILPNSSRVLQTWGMKENLEKFATKPKVSSDCLSPPSYPN